MYVQLPPLELVSNALCPVHAFAIGQKLIDKFLYWHLNVVVAEICGLLRCGVVFLRCGHIIPECTYVVGFATLYGDGKRPPIPVLPLSPSLKVVGPTHSPP